MSEIVFPSTKAGNEVDRAVTAALSTIPGQITQINTRVTALEEDVDDLSGLPAQVTQIGSKLDEVQTDIGYKTNFSFSAAGEKAYRFVEGNTYVVTNIGSTTFTISIRETKDGANHNATNVGVGKSVEITASVNGYWVRVGTSCAFNIVLKGNINSRLIYDVSTNNADAKFASLSALLSSENLSTLIPIAVRCGGMSIRFVQTSDNKYVQYRLMADEWSTDTDDWAIADESVYVKNPEFVYVKTDAEGKILWAIKTDGSIYYGAGVPQQVIDYIEEKIADLSDEYEDIVAFLNGLEKGDKTLQTILNEKVDKEEGKGLIPTQYIGEIDNPEFIYVKTDSEGKILFAIKVDGEPYFGVGCPEQVKQYIEEKIADLSLDELDTKIDEASSKLSDLESDTVWNKQQTLSSTQKAQARANIGAVSNEEVAQQISAVNSKIDNIKPINLTNNGTITNLADEEDITSENNLLKLKDRYNYVILRSDKSFASQVTKANTIYEIRYDFDLDEGSVTIPSGCTLDFHGGSVKNGTIIVGNKCVLHGNNCKCTVSSDKSLFILTGKATIDGFDIEVTEQNYTVPVIYVKRDDNSSTFRGSKISNINIDFGNTIRTSGEGILLESVPSASNSNGVAFMIFDNVVVLRAHYAFHLKCTNSDENNIGWINSNKFIGCTAWGCSTTLYLDTTRSLEMISYNNFEIVTQIAAGVKDGEILKVNLKSFYSFIENNTFQDYFWDYNATGEQPFGGLAIGDYSTLNNIPYKLYLEPNKYKFLGIMPIGSFSEVHFIIHSDRDAYRGEYYLRTLPTTVLQKSLSYRPIIIYFKTVGDYYYLFAKSNTSVINDNILVGFIIIKDSVGFMPRMSDGTISEIDETSLTIVSEEYRLAPQNICTPIFPSGTPYLKGVCAFTDIEYPAWWNGSKWVDANGIAYQSRKRGTTAQRPTPTSSDAGFQYYDTNLGKYICWNGTDWVNMDGSALG